MAKHSPPRRIDFPRLNCEFFPSRESVSANLEQSSILEIIAAIKTEFDFVRRYESTISGLHFNSAKHLLELFKFTSALRKYRPPFSVMPIRVESRTTGRLRICSEFILNNSVLYFCKRRVAVFCFAELSRSFVV